MLRTRFPVECCCHKSKVIYYVINPIKLFFEILYDNFILLFFRTLILKKELKYWKNVYSKKRADCHFSSPLCAYFLSAGCENCFLFKKCGLNLWETHQIKSHNARKKLLSGKGKNKYISKKYGWVRMWCYCKKCKEIIINRIQMLKKELR